MGNLENAKTNPVNPTENWEKLRETREYAVTGTYADSDAEAWVRDQNIPERLPDESWFEWSGRLAEERKVAEGTQGENDGAN